MRAMRGDIGGDIRERLIFCSYFVIKYAWQERQGLMRLGRCIILYDKGVTIYWVSSREALVQFNRGVQTSDIISIIFFITCRTLF